MNKNSVFLISELIITIRYLKNKLLPVRNKKEKSVFILKKINVTWQY